MSEFKDHEKRDQYFYKDTLLYKTTLPEAENTEVKKLAQTGITIKNVEVTDVIRDHYNAEVYEKDGKFIYNFWEITDEDLDPIFISVFRDTNRFGKRFVPELNCWSYVVKGFADNPFAASLKMKIFGELDNAFN